jgi:hypothetical protein
MPGEEEKAHEDEAVNKDSRPIFSSVPNIY